MLLTLAVNLMLVTVRTGDVTTSTRRHPNSVAQCRENRSSAAKGWFKLWFVAFAQTLAEGKDPSKVVYPNGPDLRSHLLQCIMVERMTSFHKGPSLHNSGPALKSIFRL